jgi:hypothetical protein
LVGEPQIEAALGPGRASKLIPEPEKQAEALVTRIEDQLWPGGIKKIRWHDIETNARCNARFAWLPPKALDGLKRVALQQARWRDTADGFVERGPFEKARTTVSVSRISYNSSTGGAHIEVKALDAGPQPIIRWSDTGPALASSPELKDLSFVTTKLRLWFLAEDPTGNHGTGEPVLWRNEITILHEPRETSSGRVVELKAAPGGALRWTFGGISPRDYGEPYTEPLPIPKEGGLLRVFAEDGDISTEVPFDFAAIASGLSESPITLQELVDRTKPAALIKRIERTDTQTAYELINQLKSCRAKASGVVLNVGIGDTSAMLRIGRDTPVDGDALDRSASLLRELLADEHAAVTLRLDRLDFSTGADLLGFVDELHEPVENPAAMVKQ